MTITKFQENLSDGKYTIKKKCIDCGRIRMCKPQDAWQVKRCLPCQGKKTGDKLKKLLLKVKSPTYVMDKHHKRRLAKIDDWARRGDEEIKTGFEALARFKAKCTKDPKPKRIWP